MPFPWGREEQVLTEHYKALGRIREEYKEIFATGEFKVLGVSGGVIAYKRYNESEEICVIANSAKSKACYELDGEWYDLLSEKPYESELMPTSCVILK
jgi:glycosidase